MRPLHLTDHPLRFGVLYVWEHTAYWNDAPDVRSVTGLVMKRRNVFPVRFAKNYGHNDKRCPLNKENTPDVLGAKATEVICIHCCSTSHVIEECEKYRKYQEKQANCLCSDCGEVGHDSEECLDERKILKRKRELDEEKKKTTRVTEYS